MTLRKYCSSPIFPNVYYFLLVFTSDTDDILHSCLPGAREYKVCIYCFTCIINQSIPELHCYREKM